jgi:hypothetical protein
MDADTTAVVIDLFTGFASGLLISFAVGLTPALLYRYFIYCEPIAGNKVFWRLAPVVTILMFVFKLTVAYLNGGQPNPNPIPWVIIYYVGKWIMTRNLELSPQQLNPREANQPPAAPSAPASPALINRQESRVLPARAELHSKSDANALTALIQEVKADMRTSEDALKQKHHQELEAIRHKQVDKLQSVLAEHRCIEEKLRSSVSALHKQLATQSHARFKAEQLNERFKKRVRSFRKGRSLLRIAYLRFVLQPAKVMAISAGTISKGITARIHTYIQTYLSDSFDRALIGTLVVITLFIFMILAAMIAPLALILAIGFYFIVAAAGSAILHYEENPHSQEGGQRTRQASDETPGAEVSEPRAL